MRKTKLWDALRFRFQKSVNVVLHCFVNLPRPVYSFHDAPVCWCFLLFSHVLTLILCFTLFLTVLTYGKRCFPGGYTSEISLTDLDRSWQIRFEAIYWTLLWALGVPWPLRLRGELDVLERSRERSDDVPWKSLEVGHIGHVGHEIRKKRDDGWTELYQNFIRT